jgi:drug/metabolite transporter (DMT)-like permease
MRISPTGPDYFAYFLLFGVGIIWGGQFLFNAQAISHFPAVTIAASRVLIGALTLTLVACFVREKPHSTPKRLWITGGLLIAIALSEAVLPLFLIAWGQQHVASSITAVIVGSVPIVTLVVSVFLRSQKSPFSVASGLSVVLGFSGIVILINPRASLAEGPILIYELAIFAGVVGFAIGLTLFEKLPHGAPIRSARNVLWIASVPLVGAALVLDKPWLLNWSFSHTLPLWVLGVVGSGLAYVMYASLIQRSGPVFTSISNFIVPLVGVVLGVSVRGEPFGGREILALAFIIGALVVNEIRLFAKPKLMKTPSLSSY